MCFFDECFLRALEIAFGEGKIQNDAPDDIGRIDPHATAPNATTL